MKTVLIFASILLFLSCRQEKNYPEFVPETKINPWEYINRISDTLEETEFSLFNTAEENLEILQKFNSDQLNVKYRVGLNRNIPVRAVFIKSYGGVCVMYDYSPICFQLNHLNEVIIDGDFYSESTPSLTDTICNKIIEFEIYTDHSINKIPIIVDFSFGLKQEFVLEMYDLIAEGYLKFLNLVSKSKHKIPFIQLNEKLQNEILRNLPLVLEYDFYRLKNNNPPPIPEDYTAK